MATGPRHHALVQNPHLVADVILDQTLLPAASTIRDEPRRLIDPAADTGHILIPAVADLWQWHTTGRVVACQIPRRPPVNRSRLSAR